MINKTAAPRAICPVCAKLQAIDEAGNILGHGYRRLRAGNVDFCLGSGMPHFGTPAGRDFRADLATDLRARGDVKGANWADATVASWKAAEPMAPIAAAPVKRVSHRRAARQAPRRVAAPASPPEAAVPAAALLDLITHAAAAMGLELRPVGWLQTRRAGDVKPGAGVPPKVAVADAAWLRRFNSSSHHPTGGA